MEFLNLIGLDWSALEDAIRLVVAMVVGALVGWERERGNRPAGLRTHMLVCMGSCLVMTASIWFANETGMGDAMRMGLPEIMARSLDTMQAQISRVQLALDPPELLIRIPRDVCSFYEFWRAAELIDVGRAVATRALDAAGY